MAKGANEAVFTIGLEDETSGASNSAADSLSRLQSQITSDTAALKQMEAAMRRLNSASSVNVKAGGELSKKIREQKNRIAEAQASYVSLGGTFAKSARSSESFTARMARLSRESGSVPGPLARVFGGVSKLSGGMSGAAMASLALVGVLLAVVAAAGAAVLAIAKIGIAHADARRSEMIHLEGLTKLKYGYAGWINQMRGSADSAKALQGYVDEVSSKVALSRDKVMQYERSLYLAGMRGGNLKAALQGIATVAAVQGEGEAQAFRGWALGAAYAGKSVRALADDVEARLGPLARRQMLSVTVQASKMRENFARLFDGINLDGFLKALQSIAELFSQQTASGKGLKEILTGLIDPLMGGFESLAPIAKRVFQGLILGALAVEGVYLDLRLAIKRVFGKDVLKNFGDMQWVARGVAGAFAAVAAAVIVIGAGLTLVAAAALAVPVAFLYLAHKAGEAVAWLTKYDWSQPATEIIRGLLEGIRNGTISFVKAIGDMAEKGWKAFKSAFGIASPSKVMARLSYDLPTGAAKGVEKGTPVFESSVRQMFDASSLNSLKLGVPDNDNASGSGGAAKRTPSGHARSGEAEPPRPLALPSRVEHAGAAVTNIREGGNRTSISIGEIRVSVPEGTQDPQAWARSLREALAAELEGVAKEMGAA